MGNCGGDLKQQQVLEAEKKEQNTELKTHQNTEY